MNPETKKSSVVRRILAQFYLDMTKYLLVLLFAFGLFDKSMQGTVGKPLLIILTLAALMSAAARAQYNIDRIDEEEKDDVAPSHPDAN